MGYDHSKVKLRKVGVDVCSRLVGWLLNMRGGQNPGSETCDDGTNHSFAGTFQLWSLSQPAGAASLARLIFRFQVEVPQSRP